MGLLRLGRRAAVLGCAIALTAVLTRPAGAVINYNYTQDFDSLPITPTDVSLGSSPAGWTDDNPSPAAGNFSIPRWYLYHPTSVTEGGFNGHQRVRIGAGGSSTGAYYSFGSSGSNERAIGDVGANTLAANNAFMYYGLRLNNNTAETLDSFTLTYDGEQWRSSASTNINDPITFAYSTNATTANWFDDTQATYTPISSLTFNTPQQAGGGSGAALDGNNALNRTAGITGTVLSGLNWTPGSDLWLRWSSLQNAATDHGMAIDNVNFQASQFLPEPASFGLFSIGALFALRRARRG